MTFPERDAALEKALSRPNMEKGCKGTAIGMTIGGYSGLGALAYGGYRLGEMINNGLQIDDSIGRVSIDLASIVAGGAVGAIGGVIIGGLSGFFIGGYFGSREEKLREKMGNHNL
jgi:hypothetical protein